MGKFCFGHPHVFLISAADGKSSLLPAFPPGSCWQIPALHLPPAGLLNPSLLEAITPSPAQLPCEGLLRSPDPPQLPPCSSQGRGCVCGGVCVCACLCARACATTPEKQGLYFLPKTGVKVGALHRYPSSPLIPDVALCLRSSELWTDEQTDGWTDRRVDSCRDGWRLPPFPKVFWSPTGAHASPPTMPFHTSPSHRLLWDH